MIRDPKKSPVHDSRFGKEQLVALSSDDRSLRKGRRAAPRTDVCRPCLFWLEDKPDNQFQGVLLDLSPYGMRLRALDPFEPGTVIFVQMMRDEEFRFPLSAPIRAEVVHRGNHYEGFVDHGLRRLLMQVKKPQESRPVNAKAPRTVLVKRPTMAGQRNRTGLERGPRGLGKERG